MINKIKVKYIKIVTKLVTSSNNVLFGGHVGSAKKTKSLSTSVYPGILETSSAATSQSPVGKSFKSALSFAESVILADGILKPVLMAS